MLTLGLATPLAAASLASVMLTALRTAVWRDGIKTGEGGYEMLLLVSSLALAESGPGQWSLDALMKSERRGAGWAAAALVAAVAGTTLVTKLGHRQPAATDAEGQADDRVEKTVSPASEARSLTQVPAPGRPGRSRRP
jgi:putative oxidoreductase